MEVMAPVVVAPTMSLVRKESRAAVEVAEARLDRKIWSWLAPEEVLTTSSLVAGVRVPMPTLPENRPLSVT